MKIQSPCRAGSISILSIFQSSVICISFEIPVSVAVSLKAQHHRQSLGEQAAAHVQHHLAKGGATRFPGELRQRLNKLHRHLPGLQGQHGCPRPDDDCRLLAEKRDEVFEAVVSRVRTTADEHDERPRLRVGVNHVLFGYLNRLALVVFADFKRAHLAHVLCLLRMREQQQQARRFGLDFGNPIIPLLSPSSTLALAAKSALSRTASGLRSESEAVFRPYVPPSKRRLLSKE